MLTDREALISPRHRTITEKSPLRTGATGNSRAVWLCRMRYTPADAPPMAPTASTRTAQKRIRLARELTFDLHSRPPLRTPAALPPPPRRKGRASGADRSDPA